MIFSYRNHSFCALDRGPGRRLTPWAAGVFISLILFAPAEASHYSSGEIFYEWIGNEPGKGPNDYRVYATLFRNINGAPIGTGHLSGCATNGTVSQSFTLSYINTSYLPGKYTRTPTDPYGWDNTGAHPLDANGWNMPDANICATASKFISEYRYAGEVTLPSASSNWKFSITPPCCRDGNDNLASAGSFFISAKLNNLKGPNSSPRILPYTQFALCVVSDSVRPHRLNVRAKDGDGDSLIYQFDPDGPLGNSTATSCTGLALGFKPGLSAFNPIPTHRPPYFDQKNAQLVFAPSSAGAYVVKVRVSELRRDTNGFLRVVGYSTLEFMMNISAQCKNTPGSFISTPRDTVIKRRCGDTIFTVKTKERFDPSTLETGASDFTLITSQNTLMPLQSVELLNRVDLRFKLRDTLGINDTMQLIIRRGLDSNTVFNVCGIPYREFDTLATLISSGCKVDTSGVGLSHNPHDALSLYPNPAGDFIQFKSMIPLGQSAYRIYNATGTVVRQGRLSEGDKRIPTAHLDPGPYWIRLIHDDFNTVKRFLKY